METKEFFRTEYMCWDDISHLGEAERNATILDEGRIKPSKYSDGKQIFCVTIQLTKNHEIFEFKVQKRTWRNLKDVWGSDSVNWRGKQVKVMPFVYAEGKTSVELMPLK